MNFGLKRKYSKYNLNGRVFVVSVDGSDHSMAAFNIISENILTPEDKLYAVYIYNSRKDQDYNYRNKSQIIMEKYSERLSFMDPNQTCLITEDRDGSYHPLVQIEGIARLNKANYLLCGFYGMRGPVGDNMELSRGVNYLLRNCSEPFIIVKDEAIRNERINQQLNWLFVFDKYFQKPTSILDKFMPLVSVNTDYVLGLTMLPSYIVTCDVENEFRYAMEVNQVEKYDYVCEYYEKSPSTFINNLVNFGEIRFDFVVIFNSNYKQIVDFAFQENSQIILRANANICVWNQGTN